MTDIHFYKHGEYVRPEDEEGTVTISFPAESRLHARLRKNQSLYPCRPEALGWIKATYADAIEYTRQTHDMRGWGFLLACMALGGLGVTLFAHVRLAILSGWGRADSLAWAVLDGVVLPGIFILFIIVVVAFCLLMDLFRPIDEPVIFDRKRRKIYCLRTESAEGWLGFFRVGRVVVKEYDWDLIYAEHYLEHGLFLMVCRSSLDSTIIERIQMCGVLSEFAVPAVWEHMRRFMEDGGPHLPTPEEVLAKSGPTNLWQSFGAVGPFGPGYVRRWREHPFVMTILHLPFPVLVFFAVLLAVGNRLSYVTGFPVVWPTEVLDRIGPATRRGS